MLGLLPHQIREIDADDHGCQVNDVGADTLARELGVAAAAAREHIVLVTSTMAIAPVSDCSLVLER